MNSSPRIWVVGSSNVDLIMKLARLPDLGETVTDGVFMQTFGGKGANSAVGAARAGGKVTFVNAVGDDPYASTLLSNMASDGIDVRHVRHEKGIASGHALVMVGEGGRNYLAVAPGANNRLLPEHVDALREELRGAGRILIQNEILPETNVRVLELANELRIPVSFNFAPAIDFPKESLTLVDQLILNETEAALLLKQCGEALGNAEEQAAALRRALGVPTVLLTLGSEGVVVDSTRWSGRVPAFRVDAVDTTAAGDIFCGALATALCESRELPQAVRFASAAAAISVTRLGAQPSAPHRNEIEAFLANPPQG